MFIHVRTYALFLDGFGFTERITFYFIKKIITQMAAGIFTWS